MYYEDRQANSLLEVVGFSCALAVMGAVTGLLLMFLAVLQMGRGHGSYSLAKIAFPYSMLSTLLTDEISTFAIVIALIQFPAYGISWGISYHFRRPLQVLLVLVILHSVGVLLCQLALSNFPS